MAKTTCTPTDQTASATSSSTIEVTDDALAGPCSGTYNANEIEVTYSLSADVGAIAKVQYSTDNGSTYSTIESISGGSVTSKTTTVGVGAGDTSQFRVRASAIGDSEMGYTATSDITAWKIHSYTRRVFVVTD